MCLPGGGLFKHTGFRMRVLARYQADRWMPTLVRFPHIEALRLCVQRSDRETPPNMWNFPRLRTLLLIAGDTTTFMRVMDSLFGSPSSYIIHYLILQSQSYFNSATFSTAIQNLAAFTNPITTKLRLFVKESLVADGLSIRCD
jgi:hypothetical protein